MYKFLLDLDNDNYDESKIICSHGIFQYNKLPDVKYIKIRFEGCPSGQFDFRKGKNLFIQGNVSKSHILFNNNADFIALFCFKGIRGDIDFSNVNRVHMFCADLSQSNIKFNQNAQCIDLVDVKGLHGYFDFSNVQILYINNCVYKSDTLQNISGIKFNPKGLVLGIDKVRKQILEAAYSNYEKSRIN